MRNPDNSNIIHFTSSLDAIAGILIDKGFRLKYCQEEFAFGKKIISSAVHAMVCFSSYAPSELGKAEITYGRYGISMTEEWALSKGVHEVLYLEKNSTPAKALASLLTARQGKSGNFPNHLRLPVMQIRCFVKNAKGKNKKVENIEFDFRSEREWRFVPAHSEIGGSRISQNQSYYKQHKDLLNARMWQHKLSFKMEDVMQIYVDNAAEVSLLANRTGISSTFFKVSTWQYRPLTRVKKK